MAKDRGVGRLRGLRMLLRNEQFAYFYAGMVARRARLARRAVRGNVVSRAGFLPGIVNLREPAVRAAREDLFEAVAAHADVELRAGETERAGGF